MPLVHLPHFQCGDFVLNSIFKTFQDFGMRGLLTSSCITLIWDLAQARTA